MKKAATRFQKNLSLLLGINIETRSFAVAAAQIEHAVAPALWETPDREPATERQIAYAASFDLDVTSDPKRVASARIQEAQTEQHKSLIEHMQLQPGTVVYWRRHKREMTISSIADNGRLWFKGGNGYGAFPHEIEPVRRQ